MLAILAGYLQIASIATVVAIILSNTLTFEVQRITYWGAPDVVIGSMESENFDSWALS